jgi:hypothetical protein
MTDMESVLRFIDTLSEAEKRAVLTYIRRSVPLHAMEERLKASAETVLEAISRSSPLTIRGIEGIIAEATFALEVLPTLSPWRELPIVGDQPYDFLLTDDGEEQAIRLQVKMQRRKEHRPLMANEVQKTKHWPSDHFVVEVQRTRRGQDGSGAGTRPYRFNDFDVLAVSLGASRGRWRDFTYTVGRWLIPDPADGSLILKYQPVPPLDNADWTGDFLEVVSRFRSGGVKTIAG